MWLTITDWELFELLLERMCSMDSALIRYCCLVVYAISKEHLRAYLLEKITRRIGQDRQSHNHAFPAFMAHLASIQGGEQQIPRAHDAKKDHGGSYSSSDGGCGCGCCCGCGCGNTSTSTQANAATADNMKSFVYDVDEANKRQRMDTRFGSDGQSGGHAGANADHMAHGGSQHQHTRDSAPCKF